MKNIHLYLILGLFMISSAFAAGEEVEIILGQGYQNDVWYNLETGDTEQEPAANWDIAFMTGMDAAIHINGAAGTELYHVIGSNADSWEGAVDTNGIADGSGNFTKLFNSNATWLIGAFNMGNDGYNTDGDYGWGDYDGVSHGVFGKTWFVIKLSDQTWKKIMIVRSMGGICQFKWADLDGSNETTDEVDKYDYSDMNFIYYSLQNSESIIREPAKTDWHLLFGTYLFHLVDDNQEVMTHGVTGVKLNRGLRAVPVSGDAPANSIVPPDSLQFFDSIATIGHEWKSFSMSTMSYTIVEDLCYWVMIDKTLYYKIVFTEYGGSQTGKIVFTKEAYSPDAVIETEDIHAGFIVQPNMIESGNSAEIVCNIESEYDTAKLDVYSVAGQHLSSYQLSMGFNTINLNTNGFANGKYLVVMTVNGHTATETIIIK